MESLTRRAGHSRTSGGGFTLIELLVAMAVLAISGAMLLIVAPRGGRAPVEIEAQRLAALIEHAISEASANGRPLAWSAERGGYAFWKRNADGEWSPFGEGSPYRYRRLPEGTMIAAVRVGARPVAEGERVLLRPHGLSAPLEATLSGGRARYLVRGNALGRVSVERLHAG